MSNQQLLQNLQVMYRKTSLRFLLMFLGVVIVPVIIFVNGGADISPQNTTNLVWQFLTLSCLLLVALLFGLALFIRKTRSLSIYKSPAAKSAADQGVI